MRNTSLVLLLALLSISMAGRIYPWGEPYIKYPNNGQISELQLFFSLETKLPAGHYLRIQLPFSAQPSVGVSVYQQTASRGTVTPPSSNVVSGSQVNAQSATPFGMWYRFGNDLNANTPYVLRLSFSTSPTDVGFLGYVQLETLSPADSIVAGTDVALSYDLNNAFAPIHIFEGPGAPSVAWGAVEATATPTVASSQYVQPIQLTLSQDFWYQPAIILKWDNAGFSIADNCKSADTGVNASVATPLTDYSCSVDQTNRQVKILHNAPVLKNQTVVYNLTITTPANGGTTTFSVWVYHRWNLNLTDILLAGPVLTVTAPANPTTTVVPALATVRALLSWGIDPKNELNSVSNSVVAIYTSTAALAKYQGIRFSFDLNTALSSGSYTVKVQVCGGTANCDILENSVAHSFGSGVICTTTKAAGEVSISCPVTAVAQTSNWVAVKAMFTAAAVTTNAISDSTFGQIGITGGSGFSAITGISLDSAYKKTLTRVETLQNYNGNGPILAVPDTTQWGYVTDATNGVTDLTTGDSVPGGTFLGLMGGIYPSTSTDSNMYVALFTSGSDAVDVSGNSGATTLWGLSSATPAGFPVKAGVDLLMNPNLWTVPSSVSRGTCWAAMVGQKPATGNLIASGDATYNAHCYSKTNSAPSWTRLRFISITAVPTGATGTDLFNGNLAFFWPAFVRTPKYNGASLKADSNVGDYYVGYFTTSATVADTNVTTVADLGELGGATLTGAAISVTHSGFFTQYHMAPHTYTISNSAENTNTQYANLDVILVGKHATSFDSDASIDLLRARGTLASGTDTYPSSATLVLFFTPSANQYVYRAPAGSTSTSAIRCFTSAASVCSLEKAQISAMTTPLNEIDFHQIVNTNFAFSTTVNSGALVVEPNTAYASGTYRVGWIGGSTGYAWIAPTTKSTVVNTQTGGTVTAAASCQSDTIGSGGASLPTIRPVMDQSSTSYYVNNQISTINFKYKTSVNYQGLTTGYGGFNWCAKWNFRASSSFGFGSVTNLEKNADKCVGYDYRSTSGADWYCVYCPITAASTAPTTTDATISLSNFKASQATDINTPTFSTMYDNNGGLLDRNYCPTTSDAWIPGTASASSTGSAFGQTAQKVTVTFTLGSTGKDAASIVLQGRQSAAPASADTGFPQGTFESNAECWVAPSTSTTISEYKKLGSCPSTGTGSLTFTLPASFSTIASNSAFKLVLWGFTGVTAPSPAPTSQYFYLYSQDGSNSEIDMTKANPTVLGDLVSWPVLSTVNTFTVSGQQYNRPILAARGTFKWDFTLPGVRPWYYLDNIVFQLDAITTASENTNANTIQCRITDAAGAINQNFKSCTFSSASTPATLTIVSLSHPFLIEFAASGIRVNLDGIKTLAQQVSAKTIYGRLYFGTSSNSIALAKDNTTTDISAPSDVSTKSFPNNYPTVTKSWGLAQGVFDVTFGLISSSAVTENFRVTIEFPTYYNPGLTTRSLGPICSIDGVWTNCQVVRPRTLQIDGFPSSKNANVGFNLRVSGLTAPVISTADNFWIQINSDRSESAGTVVYAGTILEPVVASQSVSPIHVNWFSPASGTTRALTTLTWTFNPLNSEDHGITRAVQAIFPPHWGLANGRFTPTCNVQDFATPSLIYTSTQTATVSNTITMNIATTIQRNRIVNLVCQNVRVAEADGTYASQDVQLRIVDQAGTTVYQLSAPSVHNVNFAAAYGINSNLNYLNWVDFTTTYSNTPAVYVLPRGTYSLGRAISISGRSARNIQLSVSPSQFAFLYSPFNVSTGGDMLVNYIGTPSSTPVNTYALLFSLSDSSYFVQTSSLFVQVTMDKTDLSVSPVGDVPIIFSTGVTSRSNPVVFTAYSNAPYADVTITPSVVSAYTANFTVSPTSITLTPSFAYGSFVYTTTSNTVSGETNVFAYALSGTNANSYNTPAIHNVKAVADSNVEIGITPTLVLTADGTDQGRPTYKVLNFALGSVSSATVYFGCQSAGTWVFDSDALYTAAALTFYQTDINDPFHGYYDIVVMTKATATYTIEGLNPNSNYECRAFAISNGFKNSTVASYSFRTGSNGAQINRFLFNTSTYPSAAQRQALLCTLTQYLQVPANNVIAVSGETCGNTTVFYPAANDTMIAIYFYPLAIDSDTVMSTSNLQSALNGTTTLRNLNNTVVANGGPAIFNIYADGTPQNNLVTISVPSSTVGLTWVSLSGVTLNDTGYIVAGIASNSSSAPTPIQLKQAATSNSSSGLLQVQSGYYDSRLGQVSFNFTGLQDTTSYNLYLIGTNNDPSWFQNTTTVSSAQSTTATPPSTNGLTVVCSVVMAFVAVMSLIFV